MLILKVLVSVVFGIILILGFIGGFTQASNPPPGPDAPDNGIIYVDKDAPGPTHNSAGYWGGAIFNRGFRGKSNTTLTNVAFIGPWAQMRGEHERLS